MGFWDFSQDDYKSDINKNKEVKKGFQFQGGNKLLLQVAVDGHSPEYCVCTHRQERQVSERRDEGVADQNRRYASDQS